jgi:DNA-binding NarL/FixJ family response regulator
VTLRVLVADDQTLVRAGFSGIIATTPGMAVVGEAGTGQQAVDLARSTRPDVVLMDIRMPDMDGIQATRQITGSAQTGGVRVLILTTFDLDDYVYAALRAGASGFLLKDIPPGDLLAAIRVISAGDALLAPGITRRLIREFVKRPGAAGSSAPKPAPLKALTGREREILTLVAQGLTNHEIAERLRISPATAKTHVAHLLAKLDARDRIHLVIIGYQTGLVTAG